jgi:PKD repeat protein
MPKSTLDTDYATGDLSLYPVEKDTKTNLYEVRNNCETKLSQSLSYGGKYIVAEDVSCFPASGLIRVGLELIYYGSKTGDSSGGILKDLKRGFAGSRQNQWPLGTVVSNSVMAEVHNSVKDAIINIETNLGLDENPTTDSLNGILKALETRFLSPKPIFRASPIKGPVPLTVRFQNFSGGDPVRYLWDFGDGKTSVETAPVHTYLAEGEYTVKLNMITTLGAQGIATKESYIKVDNTVTEGFYYITPAIGTTSTEFSFIDQTMGNVISRYWIFDDGTTEQQLDPDIHTTVHTYDSPGTYNTALIVVFDNQVLRRYVFDPIIVS